MSNKTDYRTITREQFLFNEMRIVATLLYEGKSTEEAINEIVSKNLFQYPTEKMIKNLAQVCVKRYEKADKELISIVATSSSSVAKQACLFLMMNYYKIVSDFMITVIGEKYRTKDFTFTKMDMNSFFTRLQEQNETVASWSEETIKKSKSVLKKLLVDNGYLDNTKSEVLNTVLLEPSIKEVIERKNAYFEADGFDENENYIWNDFVYNLDEFYDRMNLNREEYKGKGR